MSATVTAAGLRAEAIDALRGLLKGADGHFRLLAAQTMLALANEIDGRQGTAEPPGEEDASKACK